MIDGAPDWSGGVTVIAASGPSLTPAQIDYCRGRARLLVINNGHELAPWADGIYACDGAWWDVYGPSVSPAIPEKWTTIPAGSRHGNWALPIQQRAAAERFGLKMAPGRPDKGLGRDCIHWGNNSGYQAINLAYLFGARRIVLIGYDMQGTGGRCHWHDDHPSPLKQTDLSHYANWVVRFPALADDLAKEGVSVVNATIETALTCFPRADLKDAISG